MLIILSHNIIQLWLSRPCMTRSLPKLRSSEEWIQLCLWAKFLFAFLSMHTCMVVIENLIRICHKNIRIYGDTALDHYNCYYNPNRKLFSLDIFWWSLYKFLEGSALFWSVCTLVISCRVRPVTSKQTGVLWIAVEIENDNVDIFIQGKIIYNLFMCSSSWR